MESDWRISLRKGFLLREQKVSLETGSVRKEWTSGSLCGDHGGFLINVLPSVVTHLRV